ncbi:type II toxin-antitoxin system VapC family toxin [Candidatus Woesearchaeota archaeon]|nr:type II toxin-antitoxin system VapC family toxin [Candidatus Woesearchaeota archaeon]
MDFLDTYALIRLVQGEAPLLTDDIITLDFQLAELYYHLLRLYNKKTANHFHMQLSTIATSLPKALIPEAMQFRREMKAKNLSYADALGYTFAQEQKIPFVTGDQAFKGMKGVKFLK